MPLNWKPTIPEDPSPDDLTGNLRHYAFARAVRIQSGPDQGRFRWYLNDLPGATTIKKQGVEDTLKLAKQAADEQFRSWLAWVGLIPAPVASEPKQALPSVPVASSAAARPIAPPEQRLPRYLAPLCDGLAAYFQEYGPELDQLYTWAIPAVPDFVAFEQGPDSLAKANFRLKRSLSAAWHTQPDRHYDLANWYVAKWGGVPSNKEETIRAYIAQTEDDLESRGAGGVATWSKILVLRNPDRYAIFDARVAMALNALQIVQEHERPIFFPNLPSKNTTAKAFHEFMKVRDNSDAHEAYPSRVYSIYLQILREVARRLEVETLDEIEMTLFAQAETLARRAMSHPSDRALPVMAAE
ncbi:hypothetical protein IC232_31260 [Microvirga sp. BT688]|uniref:hypothetical protein n=1 Tax=Microvirga sp. TaxID=1873136 RepID=UPI001682D660|nr:hypothetical protein [Microvirga sp.]MBD2751113.1 hypothetical protein [Microvirga sp.]